MAELTSLACIREHKGKTCSAQRLPQNFHIILPTGRELIHKDAVHGEGIDFLLPQILRHIGYGISRFSAPLHLPQKFLLQDCFYFCIDSRKYDRTVAVILHLQQQANSCR